MKTPRLGGLGNNEKKWQLSNSEEVRNQVRALLATVLPGKRRHQDHKQLASNTPHKSTCIIYAWHVPINQKSFNSAI